MPQLDPGIIPAGTKVWVGGVAGRVIYKKIMAEGA